VPRKPIDLYIACTLAVMRIVRWAMAVARDVNSGEDSVADEERRVVASVESACASKSSVSLNDMLGDPATIDPRSTKEGRCTGNNNEVEGNNEVSESNGYAMYVRVKGRRREEGGGGKDVWGPFFSAAQKNFNSSRGGTQIQKLNFLFLLLKNGTGNLAIFLPEIDPEKEM